METYYHITTPLRFEKIKTSGFLIGSTKKNRGKQNTHGRSKDGKLYVVSIHDKFIFNGISTGMILEAKSDKIGYHGRNGKKYIVIKIEERSLSKRKLEVQHDKDSAGEVISPWCYSISMGNKKVPFNELKVCGKFTTDSTAWHTNHKWEINLIQLKKQDSNIRLEDLVLTDGKKSRHTYLERFNLK
jgi:hypothetical protein